MPGPPVREVDALGGVMGELTDAVGIQFRLLNSSRGRPVWSPRAQCDKRRYRARMRELLESEPNLRILQAEGRRAPIEGDSARRVRGVYLRMGGCSSRCRGRHHGHLSEWPGSHWEGHL